MDERNFYDAIRKSKLFGTSFESSEFQGVAEIIKDCAKAQWPLAYTAYALATAYHETAHTMQPIKEYGGRAYYMRLYDVSGQNPARARKMGNTSIGDGAMYCGRGYVQLTWKSNYARAARELGVNLVEDPDLAMNPDIASDIMILGMSQGWFTGKKLSNYLPSRGIASVSAYRSARYIINGQDDAKLIAEYAKKFETALVAGGWK
jgi:putative chitinase